MNNRKTWVWIKNVGIILLLSPITTYASFIESALGTAVIKDATASYYNPASLTLLKQLQFIALGSFANSRTTFTGQTTQTTSGFEQQGSSKSNLPYYLPSIYLAGPTSDKLTLGVAVVTNFFNHHIDDNSILRYVKSSNNIQNVDLVPAFGFKLNRFVSLGAGVTLSHAAFIQQPLSGAPNLNIPDAQSYNQSSGNALGAEAGVLLTPSPSTLIGLNYRSHVSYQLSGRSTLKGNPTVTSNDFYFNFWTPARSVVSINQFLTDSLGLIGTVQRVQWSIFNEVDLHGVATRVGSTPVIVNAKVPYHLHDTWIFTVGNYYQVTPKWIVRLAGTYSQAPDSGHYQISNGDSLVVGTSVGYKINQNIMIDGSISHGFIHNQNINIASGRYSIVGENKASQDALSLKVTLSK